MHLLQGRTRLDAQFVDEAAAHGPEGLECIHLSAAPVLREHHLAGQPLVERVLTEHGRQQRQQLAVPTDPQPGVVVIQCRGQPLGFQSASHIVQPRRAERRKRLPAPEPQRLTEQTVGPGRIDGRPRLGDKLAKPVQIHR
jgi:hypothetical protein